MKMIATTLVAAAVLLAGCAGPQQAQRAAAAKELGATGKLRAAIVDATVRIVGRGSAYDLFLTREMKAATLVRSPTSPAVVDMFLKENQEVAAGVKQQLEMDAKRVGGVRLLPGRFMIIEQAMGVPKGRLAAQAWLSDFIEDMKASGYVASGLQRHAIEGASVAPPRAAR